MADRKLFQAVDAFSATVDGAAVHVAKGDVVDDGDPVLKGRQDLFEPFEPKVRTYQRVEQATAKPGERRQR